MLETIAVLAVFFIIVMLAYAFYSKMLKRGIDAENEESMQLNAARIAQRASSLPELQCSQENTAVGSCIDIMKLEAMPHIINENEIYYFDRLYFSRITVNEIYPNEKEWILYDRSFEGYSNKAEANIPISLWNDIENKNAFGIMNVAVFSK